MLPPILSHAKWAPPHLSCLRAPSTFAAFRCYPHLWLRHICRSSSLFVRHLPVACRFHILLASAGLSEDRSPALQPRPTAGCCPPASAPGPAAPPYNNPYYNPIQPAPRPPRPARQATWRWWRSLRTRPGNPPGPELPQYTCNRQFTGENQPFQLFLSTLGYPDMV
jgi:hypothetical protein